MTTTANGTLYRTVADRLTHLIEHGTYRPGDRVPSVRKLSSELKVSITTVLEAYAKLESQGLIEARPQSGYYVRPRSMTEGRVQIKESRPPRRPCEIGVDELICRVMEDTRDPRLVQLGAAIPNPELLPTARLNRLLAAAARRFSDGLVGPIGGCGSGTPAGYEPLRVEIAKRAVLTGCALTPADLVVTNGCLEALHLALRAICQPGDTVAVESPTYWGILQAMQLLGLRVLEVPTHPRHGLNLEALATAIDGNQIKAVVVMSNFNNPLGSMMPDDNKKDMVELLAAHQIPLIEDDIYGDLYFGAERPRVARSYDANGLVLLCSSFSKDLAPGYRVGWIAPGRFQLQVTRLKAAMNYATGVLPQVAIADFLREGGYDSHMRRMRRIYANQTAQVATAVVQSFPHGTRVSQPAGGFVVWVELPKRIDALELYEHALREGITFAPGPLFSAQMRYRNYLRLNCGYWSERVEKALATLGQIADNLHSSPRS